MTANTKKIPVTLIRSAGTSRNQRQRSCSTKNANITFELTIPGAAEQKTVDYNVTVENMDKDAPKDAKVYWRFLENGEVQEGNTLDISNLEDQSTTDGIEVWIASESEDLYVCKWKGIKAYVPLFGKHGTKLYL